MICKCQRCLAGARESMRMLQLLQAALRYYKFNARFELLLEEWVLVDDTLSALNQSVGEAEAAYAEIKGVAN